MAVDPPLTVRVSSQWRRSPHEHILTAGGPQPVYAPSETPNERRGSSERFPSPRAAAGTIVKLPRQRTELADWDWAHTAAGGAAPRQAGPALAGGACARWVTCARNPRRPEPPSALGGVGSGVCAPPYINTYSAMAADRVRMYSMQVPNRIQVGILVRGGMRL